MRRLFSKLIGLVRDTFPFLIPLLLRQGTAHAGGPFCGSRTVHIIDEGHEAKSPGRSLAAWRISNIPEFSYNI
jgi:hypothetical protein